MPLFRAEVQCRDIGKEWSCGVVTQTVGKLKVKRENFSLGSFWHCSHNGSVGPCWKGERVLAQLAIKRAGSQTNLNLCFGLLGLLAYLELLFRK